MDKSNNDQWEPRRWIVPPGLEKSIERFDIRCDMYIKDASDGKSRPVIIHGPTGVGKSMFVDYFISKHTDVHPSTKVITVNCAAISINLLESEMFGCVKGAHSMAHEETEGYFGAIGNGILVLEEIGELPEYLQAKLLLAVENRKFTKVGSNKSQEFTGHLVATTNAKQKVFRDDFWYRFDIFKIPPLHLRREDILYYINNYDEQILSSLPRHTILPLLSYNWPGNVREIERACNDLRELLQLTLNKLKFGFYGGAIAGAVAKEIVEKRATEDISNEEIRRLIKKKLNSLKAEDLDEFLGATKEEVENEFINEILHGESPKVFDVAPPGNYAKSAYADNFNIGGVHKFLAATLSKNCNLKKIESMLNKNNLSIETNSIGFIGEKKIKSSPKEKESHFHRLPIRHFDSASAGFKVLCKMLFVNPQGNSDILNLDSHTSYTKHDAQKATNATPPTLGTSQGYFTEDMIRLGVMPAQPRQTQADKVLQLHVDELPSWPKTYRTAFLEILKCLTGIPSLKEADIVDFNAFVESNKNNRFIKKIRGCTR